MATQFTITSSDSAYSWVAENGEESNTANIKFTAQNNNVSADTQGYMRKVQQGDNRVSAKVKLSLSIDEYEDTFLLMLIYPDYCIVTFDRNIPGKGSTSGNFVFEDMKIVQEFDDGDAVEVELLLTEII